MESEPTEYERARIEKENATFIKAMGEESFLYDEIKSQETTHLCDIATHPLYYLSRLFREH